jgi:histidyl-tRNA synthetase
MHDILPEEAVRWQWLESQFRAVVARYGFGEIRTPLLEPTELFVKEIGENTDVVEKEMYSFDRHDDSLTVRPEGTASAARAYVQHAVSGREPISRWFYIGPMFRAERPAKGRYRQFHQAGCEIYGDAGPVCDAELIALCADVVTALGIRDFTIHINSLGAGNTRQRFRDALAHYFTPRKKELSDESQRRLATNPLRILDSKAPQDQALALEAPSVLDLLDDEDRAHFDALQRYLDALGVAYQVDARLVRGLDYYTRTLFELKTTSDELGAQGTLIGGGRYDNMVQNLGHKKPVPAIGFAMGIERILALSEVPVTQPSPDCYLAPMVEAALPRALVVAQALRAAGLVCEVDGRGQSVKSMLRRADSMRSRSCILIGQEELDQGHLTVKHLAHKTQAQINFTGSPGDAVANIVALVRNQTGEVPVAARRGASPVDSG